MAGFSGCHLKIIIGSGEFAIYHNYIPDMLQSGSYDFGFEIFSSNRMVTSRTNITAVTF